MIISSVLGKMGLIVSFTDSITYLHNPDLHEQNGKQCRATSAQYKPCSFWSTQFSEIYQGSIQDFRIGEAWLGRVGVQLVEGNMGAWFN